MINTHQALAALREVNPAADEQALSDATWSTSDLLLEVARRTAMQTQQTTELRTARPTPPPKRSRGPLIALATAVAVLAIGVVFALASLGGDTVDPEPATTLPTVTTVAPTTVPPVTTQPPATTVAPTVDNAAVALDVATQFMEARVAWDGETMRSLFAPDARIAGVEFAGGPDEFGAVADFERVTGQRYLDVECSSSAEGRVVCTYTLENKATQALGVGPFTGNSFLFQVTDGEIAVLNNNLRVDEYIPQAVAVFRSWMLANHPDDIDVMYRQNPNLGQDDLASLTPESIALWEIRTDEFVASMTDSGS